MLFGRGLRGLTSQPALEPLQLPKRRIVRVALPAACESESRKDEWSLWQQEQRARKDEWSTARQSAPQNSAVAVPGPRRTFRFFDGLRLFAKAVGATNRDILENQSTTASGLDEADLLVTPRRLAKTGALSFWTMTFQFVCVRVQTVRKSARAWQACSSLLPSLGWPLVKKLSKGLKRLELCHLVSHGEV